MKSFRPFPYAAVAAAVGTARRVLVVERAFELGAGGIVSRDVRTAAPTTTVHTVVAGLGGRPVTRASLHELLAAPDLPELSFLDLRTDVVAAHLAEVGG